MLKMGVLFAVVSCGKVEPTTMVVDGHVATDGFVESADANLCATMNCDDGDSCTTDSCAASTCMHTLVSVTPGQQTFAANGGLQTFTPGTCVRAITIDAAGAQGGSSTTNTQPGGLGAHIKGDFTLTMSVVTLSVLVGGAGGGGVFIGGGGGGTYVWDPASLAQPYLVAGGGGGAGYNLPGQPGLNTEAGGDGGSATTGGGTAGSGGIAPTAATNWAAGGAGWLSDGAAAGGTAVASQSTIATGGKAPKDGGAGGTAGGNAATPIGGFGGGGGGQGEPNATGGGGGGGYSGGGAGIDLGDNSFSGGGGGGSLNAGMNVTNTTGVNAGPGSVTISW